MLTFFLFFPYCKFAKGATNWDLLLCNRNVLLLVTFWYVEKDSGASKMGKTMFTQYLNGSLTNHYNNCITLLSLKKNCNWLRFNSFIHKSCHESIIKLYFCHSQYTWQCFDMSSMINCHKKVKCVGWSNEENLSFGLWKKSCYNKRYIK